MRADGLRIAERECGACHAVRATGESPYPGAPPLRRLSGRVSLAALETDFAEGISMGHPDMPQFQFDLDGVDALLAYLTSIQEEDPGEP
jgi:mono/diheme cytochrome c family protein